MPSIYEASSNILVKFGRENIYMPTNPAASGNPPIIFDSSREERINSEVQILKGRNLIEKVINDLGIKNIYPDIVKKPLIQLPFSNKLSPLMKATIVFYKNLKVTGIKKSDIINIKFQHKDPIIATQVVNKLINTFLEYHLTVFKQPQKYDFFNEQVSLLKKRLKESENELETFQKQNHITSINEQKTFLLKQISEMELELAKTRATISNNEGKMLALNSHSSTDPSELKMGEETDLNPFAISTIRERLAGLKLKEEELMGIYTDQSVFVVNIREEIKKAQELLAQEEKTYHDKAITSISHTLNALRSEEKRQKQHLVEYQHELNRIKSVEVEIKELEREVKLNEDNYQLYVKNMEEARISNAMDNQKIANISIIEPALPPMKPVKPKKMINLIVSLFLGGFVSLGVAFLFEFFNLNLNTFLTTLKNFIDSDYRTQ
jgi:uncharacterized protein involved in exopolysaccharide biosynthesis